MFQDTEHLLFEHKEIHKYMWKRPGRGPPSIIDYFLVRGDMKRNVNDIKVIREVKLAVITALKVKLCRRAQARKVEK